MANRIDLPAVPPERPTGAVTPGNVITRVYKGRTIAVVVRDDRRFEYDGIFYNSLSAVAKAVTGSHWNGRLFFFGRRGEKTA